MIRGWLQLSPSDTMIAAAPDGATHGESVTKIQNNSLPRRASQRP